MRDFTVNMSSNSGTVKVNGQVYHGKSVTINNGQVVVDGRPQGEVNEHIINVYVEGDCTLVQNTNGDIKVNGSVAGDAETTNGDIEIDGYVGGNVKSHNGDIRCGVVHGNVSNHNGDVNHR